MALVLKKLYNGYFWLSNDLADPRSDELYFTSPLACASIICTYLYIVKKLLPKFMEDRKPFEIKNYIRANNVIQVIGNLYITVRTGKLVLGMSWICAAVDFSDGPDSRLAFTLAYIFYLYKILDMLDTVFFVLRKSYRQITFLHVYHHSAMVFCIWVGVRYLPGGEGLWLMFINSMVHAIMYGYYLLSTFDDKWKAIKYKKLVTQIQIVQFVILLVTFGKILFQASCEYPRWIAYLLVTQNLFMTILFGDFYRKAYLGKKTT